jgi:hypothetical protein
MSSDFSPAVGGAHGDGRPDHGPFGIIKGFGRAGGEPMTYAVPVVDLENVQLEAVRAGARELGAVQVVNHGVPAELSENSAGR